jgi:predicted oxidoreductase
MEIGADVIISRLVAGCWRIVQQSRGELKRVEAFIDGSVERGISAFDHADVYGRGEAQEIFGAALRARPGRRNSIQLISKCGIAPASMLSPQHRVLHLDASREYIVASVERSLRALCTDHLDIFLLHRPDVLMQCEEVAEAFTQLSEQGKVRSFGVSNFSSSQFALLQAALPFPLITNQIELSVLKTDALRNGVLDDIRVRGIVAMAWSTLGGGRLFADPANEQLINVMASVAERYGVTVTAVAIAWILRLPARITPVLGTMDPERLTQAARGCFVVLDRQDWYEIFAAAGNSFA